MKKLIPLIISLSIFAIPAQAGNDAGAFIGGLIGGVIIGDMLNNGNRHGHYYEERYYEPRHRRCKTVWQYQWDPYIRDYVEVPRKVCRYH